MATSETKRTNYATVRPGGSSGRSRGTIGLVLRRLALWAGIAAAALYVVGVAAAFAWLRYGRAIEGVRLFDIAFFRTTAIRRTFAVQQFAQAKREWDAKNYQSAYISFASAVRNDPDNIEGRLNEVRFLGALGATNLVINALEDGLARAPDDRRLNETLFALLLSLGRHRHALELLHGRYAPGLAGPNAAILQAAELQATLLADGAPAAQAVLAHHPALLTLPNAAPIVANVLWQAGEKSRAIEILQGFVQANPGQLSGYLELAGWQRDSDRLVDAMQTAMTACKQLPAEPGARILLLDIGSARIFGTPDWSREIALYLRDFAGRPEAIVRLAELAGRRGWVDLAHALYELGAVRHVDLGALALYYQDALVRQSRRDDARRVLAEIEQQAGESSSAFQQQLRQRQIALAALGEDRDGIREYARRLAVLVRNDPDALGHYRQFYQKLGLADAVAELAETKAARVAPKPADKGA